MDSGVISKCHLNNWLSRSRRRMLDLRFYSVSPKTLPSAIQTAMHVLAPHTDRWGTMRLSLRDYSEMKDALSGWPSSLLALEDLSLSVAHYMTFGEYDLKVTAQRLRRLVLLNFPCLPSGFPFHQHFPALTRVHLGGLTLYRLLGWDRPQPLALLNALAPLPHLEHLCIIDPGIRIAWSVYSILPHSDRAILSALKKIHFQAVHLDCIVAFMNTMEAPKLSSILCTGPYMYCDMFDSVGSVERDHHRHFPQLQRFRVCCDNSWVMNDPHLLDFIDDFRFKWVDFMNFRDKISKLIKLAGDWEDGAPMKSSRLISVEIHLQHLSVPVVELRQLVVGRHHSKGSNSSPSQPEMEVGSQQPSALEELRICTSEPIAETDRAWFTGKPDLKHFSWSDSRACLEERKSVDERRHLGGRLRMTFAPK
ncbi:hypothetical protein BKA93DRAFT_795318 [Sparassis latifolia]